LLDFSVYNTLKEVNPVRELARGIRPRANMGELRPAAAGRGIL